MEKEKKKKTSTRFHHLAKEIVCDWCLVILKSDFRFSYHYYYWEKKRRRERESEQKKTNSQKKKVFRFLTFYGPDTMSYQHEKLYRHRQTIKSKVN